MSVDNEFIALFFLLLYVFEILYSKVFIKKLHAESLGCYFTPPYFI